MATKTNNTQQSKTQSAVKDIKMIEVKYWTEVGGFPPTKAHEIDAGFDIRTPISFRVPPYGSAIIDTKLHVFIPAGYCGMLKSKSGLNVNHDLRAEGVIDAGYQGRIVCKIYNDAGSYHVFNEGDKIVQLVIIPLPAVKMIEDKNFGESERGSNGFGSSGK